MQHPRHQRRQPSGTEEGSIQECWLICTAARTSSWRCSVTNYALPVPISNAIHLLRLQKNETPPSNKPAIIGSGKLPN